MTNLTRADLGEIALNLLLEEGATLKDALEWRAMRFEAHAANALSPRFREHLLRCASDVRELADKITALSWADLQEESAHKGCTIGELVLASGCQEIIDGWIAATQSDGSATGGT